MHSRRVVAFVALLGVLAVTCRARPEREPALGGPEVVAPGVDLYRTTDSALVEGAGPIAVALLKLDPARVHLMSALSNGEVMSVETVEGIARRHGAIAAVNGGFFNVTNGEPTGLLKVAGELVSDASAPKGAVVIHGRPAASTTLMFDQLAAKMSMTFTASGKTWTVPVDGVDTTRARGKLMLYTPTYHTDTDTAPTGTEWVLSGDPLRVVDVRMNFGHTKIPLKGAVLSYGGTDLPDALAALVEDVRVSFDTTWTSMHGLADADLDAAAHIVSGAGLLRRDGRVLTEWRAEGLRADTFTDMRHPRTFVGVDRSGAIWLGAVDGRQPDYSIGMTFADLQRLCDRLNLASALNLDGGGSTTMIASGRLVNRPSDSDGPRPVSDALVVTLRE